MGRYHSCIVFLLHIPQLSGIVSYQNVPYCLAEITMCLLRLFERQVLLHPRKLLMEKVNGE